MVAIPDGLALQIIAVLVGLLAIWLAQKISDRILGPSRSRSRKNAQAHSHFIKGAQLLARSRSSSSSPSEARSLAKQAAAEADLAIEFNPLDAAYHVLKSSALEQQGLTAAALRSMDLSLSPRVAESLSISDMHYALLRRGGLLLATSKGRKNLDAAIADLEKAVSISSDNPKAFCILAQAQEKNRMYAEAEKSYQRALALDPESEEARSGLMRLRP